MSKPRIFIGSSVEGLKTAEYLQLGLEYHAECTIWHQGVFGLSGGTLEALSLATHNFEFAILVLSPDDLVHKRGVARNSPRDNVLFELGLFMGALGRDRTFIVYCRDESIDLPTDLAGVTAATFSKRSDNNLQAALGPACTQIRLAIERAGPSSSIKIAAGNHPSSDKFTSELSALRSDFLAQTEQMRKILSSLTEKPTQSGTDMKDLLSLEGIWEEADSGSIACVKVTNGIPRFIYAYGGGDQITGEYYNWRTFGGALIARFKWFNNMFSGFSYLERVSASRMKGGWWLSDEASEHLPDHLPSVDGMAQTEWNRLDSKTEMPDWAKEFFNSEEKLFNSFRKK